MSEKTDEAKLNEYVPRLNDFYLTTGQIASTWAALELCMDELIWKLADVNPGLGAAITSQLTSAHTRKRIINALLKLRDGSEEHIKAVNRFDFTSALEKRNRAVHDPWSLTPDGEVAQLRVAIERGELKVAGKIGSMSDLNETLKEVSDKLIEFTTISRLITSWLSSSPQKWREPLGNIQLLHTNPKDQENET